VDVGMGGTATAGTNHCYSWVCVRILMEW
jgi:hypothetical protein